MVLVQDPGEAAHKAMPSAVIADGTADLVLPVAGLVAQLTELARDKKHLFSFVQAAHNSEDIVPDEEKALKSVLDLLAKRTGHDFSKYKRGTILRRLSRRMQLVHQLTIGDYLRYLREHASEVQSLFDDFLITVTAFFRDPESWTALQRSVIGPLVEAIETGEQIRVWVPACATGEEAYTLAILFHEEFERRQTQCNLIIFASDVDESALATAREGVYLTTISADVDEARLNRYFRQEDDHYRVINEIRDHLVFAAHNVLRDPPFSRMHLISCRNLLIYLDPELQERVMRVFRYACRDRAHLFLGASETADGENFEAVDKKHRIFMTRNFVGGRRVLPELFAIPAGRPSRRETRQLTATESHLAALEGASPPSVLIDDHWNVLHLSPSASRFFQQSGGTLARRVTELVRAELREELHALLHRIDGMTEGQLSRFVLVKFNGDSHLVTLFAQLRQTQETNRPDILVTFLDAGRVQSHPSSVSNEAETETVRHLRDDLRQAELRIESARDDHYLTSEDLRAANEELQSLNEEYRSTTEELETSKEEPQSVNEELETVNLQLKTKLDEVSRTNDDLENLMAATNVATLFLNAELRIKRFTPSVGEIFNVKTRDYDRPIGDITHSLNYESLEADARRVLESLQPIEREITSADGLVFMLRLSPYRTSSVRQIDGVVATFIDVTAIKKGEVALRASEQKLAVELNVMRRLHRMTLEVATAPAMQDALNHLLVGIMDLQGAELGNVQLLDAETQQLRIVAQHGFGPAFLKRFERVGTDDDSSCGRAMREGVPVHISDVTTDARYKPYLEIASEAGYRAVQSTPLINRKSELVGMLSVHFRNPKQFTEREQQISEMLARQAADLIESRSQQEHLGKLNEALNKRTTELEASEKILSRQAAELREQDRNRQDFLAALGHELRNPMAAIHASLTVMSAHDEPSRRALAILRRQTIHMTRIVNDLLDIARISHGRLHLERMIVDLNAAVLAAVETIRQQAEKKSLSLDYDILTEPVFVDADPERLAQIFDNLLRNAVNYTDTGGIRISARKEGSFAVVTIKDTGIGIDPRDASALFKPYQQGERARRGGGLGLGLTVVKGLVQEHGGTVTVVSEGIGRGSQFTVKFPLAEAEPGIDSDASIIAPPKRRILVVDDQVDVADTLVIVLERLGQDTRVAYDGETAIRTAAEHRPDVAFLDISMPGMNGVELGRRLRADFPNGELSIVAVSGKSFLLGNEEERIFDHRLLKPQHNAARRFDGEKSLHRSQHTLNAFACR